MSGRGRLASALIRFSGRGLGPRPARALRRVLARILEDHALRGALSVVFVDDAAIAKLHGEWFADPTPTDVITFPLEAAAGDGGPLRGDPFAELVISLETAAREARKRRQAPAREAALYAIHGALHLAGHDDREPAARRRMRAAERRYQRLYDLALAGHPSRAAEASGSRRRARAIQPPPSTQSPS